MHTRVIVGDVRTRLARLASESVHCIVTSPPYFGLRSYLPDGHPNKHQEVGTEATPDAYIAELVTVFREARRALRKDGTFWLNLGDSYAANRSYQVRETKGTAGHVHSAGAVVPDGLKAKDRLMIPARVALALQSDGWWLRDEIIWHKPNPMPVSLRDRTTPAHEMLYMFSRSARYAYDMDAIKEPASENGHGGAKANSGKKAKAALGLTPRQRGHDRPHTGFNTHWDAMNHSEQCAGLRQPRSVWTVTPKPFKGAHFATFPPDLIRPCILAGCPRGGTVLDPFFGAGTTGLVAQQLGRRCVGIELNVTYAAMALLRITVDNPHAA